MSEDRRYIRLELPGETIVMDVPAVPSVKRLQQVETSGYPVNMIYAAGEDMEVFRPEPAPEDPKE